MSRIVLNQKAIIIGAVAAGCLLAGGGGSRPAFAQANLGVSYMNMASSLMSTNMINGVLAGTARHGSHKRSGKRRAISDQADAAAKNGASPASVTTYYASPVVTEKVTKQYLDWVRKQNAADADKLQAVFVQHSPVNIWSTEVKGYGLHPGDVSDAFASYWILNYLIATQGKTTTPAQAQAVLAQIRPVMAQNAAFARFTDPQKQELAEVWMVNFVVQQSAFSAATQSHDAVMLQKLADAASARFQNEMKIDLRHLVLTDEGFAPKKG